MPTAARVRRDGVPMHRHPVLGNSEGRWHGPWERHANDIAAHARERAAEPVWTDSTEATVPTIRNYHRAMAGEQLINWGSRNANAGGGRATNTGVRRQTMGVDFSFPPFTPEQQQVDGEVRRRILESFSMPEPVPEEEAVAATVITNNRRFGVEIECITNKHLLLQLLHSRNISVEEENYNHHTRRYWKLTTDSSVHYDGKRAIEPVELVSPPLIGDIGMENLEQVCLALKDAETIVNKTCGLHVHHDAPDMTIVIAKILAHNYQNVQRAMDKLVSPSRRSAANNTFCQQFNAADLRNIDSWGRHSLRESTRELNRYRNLNLQAYSKYGTVEFRQHQGTIDFDKIKAWINLGQLFMKLAVRGVVLPQISEPEVMFQNLEADEELAKFYSNRYQELNRGEEDEVQTYEREETPRPTVTGAAERWVRTSGRTQGNRFEEVSRTIAERLAADRAALEAAAAAAAAEAERRARRAEPAWANLFEAEPPRDTTEPSDAERRRRRI